MKLATDVTGNQERALRAKVIETLQSMEQSGVFVPDATKDAIKALDLYPFIGLPADDIAEFMVLYHSIPVPLTPTKADTAEVCQ